MKEGEPSFLRDEFLFLHKTSQIDSDKTLAACGRAGGGMLEGIRLPLSLGTSSQSWWSSSPRLIWRHIYSSTGIAWVLEMLPLLILMMFCFSRDVSAPRSSAHCFEVSLPGCPGGDCKLASSFRHGGCRGAVGTNGCDP